MNLDPAIVSIISSACVAVAGILLPAIIILFNDRTRWAREQKATTLKAMDTATTDFLAALALFRIDASNYLDHGAHWDDIYTDVLKKFYAWEHTIWPYWSVDEQASVDTLRARLEAEYKYPMQLNSSVPDIAKKTLVLAHSASEKVK